MTIVLIEDNQKINRLLSLYLMDQGHTVLSFFDAESALLHLEKNNTDIVITDLMLPQMQGETLIASLRLTSDVYIIVITAKTDLQSRLNVLELGADDCIQKPFSFDEIKIKLTNVAKRIQVPKVPMQTSHFYISQERRQVIIEQKEVTLTPKEFDILYYLFNNYQQVMSREQILNACELNLDSSDRTVDVLIKNIRQKMKAVSPTAFIKTYYGIGYAFGGENDETRE